MNPNETPERTTDRGWRLESIDGLAAAEESRFGGGLIKNRREPYLPWLGLLVGLVVVLVGIGTITHTLHWPGSTAVARATTDPEVASLSAALPNRLSCADIGSSDLHSPSEGVWAQANCFPSAQTSFMAPSTDCNRTSLGDGFTPIAPGLFVSRLNPAAEAFLWYGRSDKCFDLVSARETTAVCGDQTVSFQWDARSACANHGGILAWVNGR